MLHIVKILLTVTYAIPDWVLVVIGQTVQQIVTFGVHTVYRQFSLFFFLG